MNEVAVDVDDIKVVVGRDVVSAGAVEVVDNFSGEEVATVREKVTGVDTKGRTEVVA